MQQQIETPLPDCSQPNSPRKSPYKSPYRSPYRSPYKSPSKRYSYNQSPTKSPYGRRSNSQRQFENEPLKAKPRNIYNEIVDAQSNFSLLHLPPSLKDSRYMTDEPNQPQLQQPALSQVPENYC